MINDRYPPGPNYRSLCRRLLKARGDFPGLLTSLARDYGDIVHIGGATTHYYLLSHPDDIRDVLVTRGRDFVQRRGVERLVEDGMLVSAGERHYRQRRAVSPALHGPCLDSLGSVMVECSARARASWQDGAAVDIVQEMKRLTLAVMWKALFDTDPGSELDKLADACTAVMEYLSPINIRLPFVLAKIPLPGNRRFKRARDHLAAVIGQKIRERRSGGANRDDLLSTLLGAQGVGDGESGTPERELRDELLTILFAGHETTTNALAWTWYLLSQHPRAMAELQAELDVVLTGRLPAVHDIEHLRYTRMVLAEAMRLYPPVWLVIRQALSDCEIGDYCVPAGSLIFISQYVVHRDPRYFSDPFRFDPQRWTSETGDERPQFAYFPFGGGHRSCVGEHFAWMEGVLVIAALAQQWQMKLTPGRPVRLQPRITLRPAHGIRMLLERRKSAAASR
jgi:cytochrome P450